MTAAAWVAEHATDTFIPLDALDEAVGSPRERWRSGRELERAGYIEVLPRSGWRLLEYAEGTPRYRHLGHPNDHSPLLKVSRGVGSPGRQPLPGWLRERVIERDAGVCGLCGDPIPEGDAIHIDHILPVAHGGTNTLSNLQTAHATCNLRKGARV
jgi:5-methylcytosine-specific restriction endonuclease McrA